MRQMARVSPGPPALIARLEISSLPGALSGCRRLITESISAQVKGVGLSAGGRRGRMSSSMHVMVGALVPWKRRSACSSGTLVRMPVWDLGPLGRELPTPTSRKTPP